MKRLSTVCLYVPPHAALSVMHAVRLCLNKYPKAKALLDREATASGVHLDHIDEHRPDGTGGHTADINLEVLCLEHHIAKHHLKLWAEMHNNLSITWYFDAIGFQFTTEPGA